MKKFMKVLSAAALASLMVTGVVATASCGAEPTVTSVESGATAAAKLVILDNDGNKIESNFELPATVKNNGVTYNLTWHSNNETVLTMEYTAADGDIAAYWTAVVHRPEAGDGVADYTEATFYATVENADKTESATSATFSVRVHRLQSAQEDWESWLNGTASSYTIKGYVYKKVGYVSNYKEANIIVYDEEGLGAYFVYNCYMDQDVYNSLEGGEYVTVTKATRSPYNGLLETKFGATATIDTTKEKLDLTTIPAVDISEAIYTAQTSDLTQYQSMPVEVKNFKVTAINTLSTTAGKYGTTLQTIVTLERAGQTLNVAFYEGITSFADASTKAVYDAICAKISVGTYVDVSGLLSWDSAPVLVVDSADAFTVSTAGATDYDKAVEALSSVTSQFASFYGKSTTVTLPATAENGTAYTYAVSGSTASIADGVLTIAPTAEQASFTLTITATCGDVSKTATVTANTQALTAEQIVAKIADEISLDDIDAAGLVTFSATDDVFGSTITFALKDGNGVVTESNGKLIANPTTEDKTITLTATVVNGDATTTKDITVTVKGYELVAVGDISTLAENTYFYTEGYITKIANATYGNVYLGATADATDTVYVYGLYELTSDFANKSKTAIASDSYAVGSKVRIYGYKYTYVNSTSSTLEVMNAVACYVSELPDSAKVANAAKLFKSAYTETTTVTLPTGVTAAVTAGTSAVVADGVVTITPTETADSVTLTFTAGEATQTVTFTTQLPAANTLTATLTIPTQDTTETTDETTNYAERFGLDATIFTVKFVKSTETSNNTAKLHYSGYAQLYSGCSVVISVASGYKITNLKFTYANKSKAGTLTIGSTTTDPISNDHSSDSVAIANLETVTILSSASAQACFNKVVVSYVAE